MTRSVTERELYPYPVDLNTPGTLEAFTSLLAPYTPYSLPILGAILHSGTSEDKIFADYFPGERARSHPPNFNLQVWSSEPEIHLQNSSSKLFSIISFTPSDRQFRFFCSAEASHSPPTSEQQDHVSDILQSTMRVVVAQNPDQYTSLLAPKSTDGVERNLTVAPIVIGSVHEKWATCLQPHSHKINPCIKFLYPPLRSHSPSGGMSASQLGYSLSSLQEFDIDVVQAASGISRSREYLLERRHFSVCVRVPYKGDETSYMKPIAWVLMHSDGSIGTLHVDPEHRGKGLGRLLIQELVKRCSEITPSGITRGGGTLGWYWTDVVQANEQGAGFMGSLEGWEKGWSCYWVYMTVDEM